MMAFCGINVMLNKSVHCLLCFMFQVCCEFNTVVEKWGKISERTSLMHLTISPQARWTSSGRRRASLASFWLSFYIRQWCVDLCSPFSSPLLSCPPLSSPFSNLLISSNLLTSLLCSLCFIFPLLSLTLRFSAFPVM